MKKFVTIVPSVLLALQIPCQVSLAQSVNQGSQQAGGQNDSGKDAAKAMQGMLAAMAAMEASQCKPMNPMPCMMAALHAMMAAQAGQQADEHGDVSGQAATTASNSDGSVGGGGAVDNSIARDEGNGGGTIRPVDDNLVKLINGIDGAKYDPKTGAISYNGTNLNNVDPTSADSLKSAGFPDAAVTQVLALNDRLNKAVNDKIGAMTAANGYDEGGAGGGAGGATAGAAAKGGGLAGVGLKLDRSPANVAGMQKNFNGEPIGVSGDNIFQMMTRRYQTKERQSAFYDDLDLALKQK